MEEQGASDDEIHAFLRALADAVNGLCDSGAYHADLAGKNILTMKQSLSFANKI